MFKTEKRDYGYHMLFDGTFPIEEMDKWYQESLVLLKSAPKEFSVFVDMRGLKPLSKESKIRMEEGQGKWKAGGMIRSVMILDNSIISMQFKRIARQSGIYDWQRYIDASSVEDWEKAGIDWLENGTDPDA